MSTTLPVTFSNTSRVHRVSVASEVTNKALIDTNLSPIHLYLYKAVYSGRFLSKLPARQSRKPSIAYSQQKGKTLFRRLVDIDSIINIIERSTSFPLPSEVPMSTHRPLFLTVCLSILCVFSLTASADVVGPRQAHAPPAPRLPPLI